MFKLLKFARSLLNQAKNMLTSAINQLQEGAMAPIRQMVGQVTGGIWKGNGADRFVQEMTSEVLPEFVKLVASIGGVSTNYDRAAEIIENADKAAMNKINSLQEIFQRVS